VSITSKLLLCPTALLSGDYKCDGCPDAKPLPDEKGFKCKPMPTVRLRADNRLESDDPVMQIIVEGGWRNKITLPVIDRLGIPIIHTWNQSVPLWEYHHGFQVPSHPPSHKAANILVSLNSD
jgi:hypothetical protein